MSDLEKPIPSMKYLDPAAAYTLLALVQRHRETTAAKGTKFSDAALTSFRAEHELLQRSEAEEVRQRRDQLQQLQQEIDEHSESRAVQQRRLVAQIDRNNELVALRCERFLHREDARAVRQQLQTLTAVVAAHNRQIDAGDAARHRRRDHTLAEILQREGRVVRLHLQLDRHAAAHVASQRKRRARICQRLLVGVVLWLARTRLGKAPALCCKQDLHACQSRPPPRPVPAWSSVPASPGGGDQSRPRRAESKPARPA